MALVNWSEKLSVKVKSIDEQHRVLFNAINDLHAAMMKGQAKTIVGELLNTLLKYTREHFSFEEKLMESTGYPQLSAHKVEHQKLTKQVEEFAARHQQGEIAISTHLSNFLSEWLTKHIQEVDQKYEPWLTEHGVH